jgi:hypothetical protein
VPRPDLRAKIDAYTKNLVQKVNRGQQRCMEKELQLSQEIVPVETGALHDSGHTRTTGVGKKMVAIAGYAGEGFNNNSPVPLISSKTGLPLPPDRRPSEYAIPVHEDPAANHGDKEFKFMTAPIDREIDVLREAFNEGYNE